MTKGISQDIHPGTFILWNGEPAKIISVNPGHRSLGIEMLVPDRCPHCHGALPPLQFDVIESSPLFQESASPLPTIDSKEDNE